LFIPFFGWILSFPAALIIVFIEGYKVINDERGRRFGDNLAGTQVTEEETEGIVHEITPEREQAQAASKQDMKKFVHLLLVIIITLGLLCSLLGVAVYKLYKDISSGVPLVSVSVNTHSSSGTIAVQQATPVVVDSATVMAANTPTAPAELPDNFPSDITLPPYSHIEMSNKNASEGSVVMLTCYDTVDDVVSNISRDLKSKGYQITDSVSMNGMTTFSVSKDDKDIMFQVSSDSGKTNINIMY
jgi:hypothetical protein